MNLSREDWLALSDNVIGKYDFPDPDVIRVGEVYYLVTTTMHFMPGCEILRSYDLLHWEHAAYVYETLDGTAGQRLEDGKNIYGKGMWAASIRYHRGKFYICFVANDTHKTYLYTAADIGGPWEKRTIEGFYHDCSLLFDDQEDGTKVYIVYGNRQIWLTELKEDLSGPKEGGLHRMIVSDEGHPGLGYEGSHLYRINGRYYVFFIHSRRDRWMRVEACFSADSLEGEFTGGDIFEDTMGYCGQGVAQGGIVDTPEGKWYAVLFQDRGAAGRMPVLLPVTWEKGRPVFGDRGKMPDHFEIPENRPDIVYRPLTGSDDFRGTGPNMAADAGKAGQTLADWWQFNHEPRWEYCRVDREKGAYYIVTSQLCSNLTEAPNTITQRMRFPSCEACVTVDGSGLLEGDYAGICAFQGCYGAVALTLRDGRYFLVMQERNADNQSLSPMKPDRECGAEVQCIPAGTSRVCLKVRVDFWQMRDEATFFYQKDGTWKQIGGTHKLYFKMDHFTGCRFGLFAYATKQTGGQAEFCRFVYL